MRHLQKQESYLETMSTYQAPYGEKLSCYAFRFQLMLETHQWLSRWIDATVNHDISLTDYMKKVTINEIVVPSLVSQWANPGAIWCFPEVRTHEEAVLAVENTGGRRKHRGATHDALKEVVKNWMSTWFTFRSRGTEPSAVLEELAEDHEEMRSMGTCSKLKDWMLAFHMVFELQEGPRRDLVLKLMLRRYDEDDLRDYTKKIHGCTCGQWHRYLICIHAMGYNILKKALPYPQQWDPRKYKGAVMKKDVRTLLQGKGGEKSKVPDALKSAHPTFLCFNCCKRRKEKSTKRKHAGRSKEHNTPTGGNKRMKKTKNVLASDAESPGEQSTTPRTPRVEGIKRKRREGEGEGEGDNDDDEGETDEDNDEQMENATDDVGLLGKVRFCNSVFVVDDGEGTTTGPCGMCRANVRVRNDLFGSCEGDSHNLPEAAYNAGFRRLMMPTTRKTGSQSQNLKVMVDSATKGDPKNYRPCLNRDTEGSVPKAQESQAMSEVVVELNKEDKVIDKDNEDANDSGLCCCGCGVVASGSSHWCSKTNRRILAFCMQPGEGGFGSAGICKGCVKGIK